MDYVTGVFSNVHSFASKINPSTLSGAIDIVFVKQPDGRYSSTPFYVKFGKLGVLRAKEKIVYIEINGVELDMHMLLNDSGTAYFDFDSPDTEAATTCRKDSRSKACATSQSSVENSTQERCRRLSEPLMDEDATFHTLSMASKALSNSAINSSPSDSSTHSTKSRSGSQSKEICSKTAGNSVKFENPPVQCEEEDTTILEMTTLSLTESELQDFNLVPGLNEAAFSVTTQYQGTTRCLCSIFVWDQNTKIIISDIDGTITRSDVRGMILPMIGLHDWAQDQVTHLYSKIVDNGYQILYLSARSISQAGTTREYIRSLQQGQLNLPHGPLFLNPEGALRAFKKEVIDKQPEQFKIQCLSQLKDLFVRGTPYVAGYGNRPNDIVAYQTVGIPVEKIFIIDKTGGLKGSTSETMLTSYQEQSRIVDYYFPPIDRDLRIDHKYWEPPLPDIGI